LVKTLLLILTFLTFATSAIAEDVKGAELIRQGRALLEARDYRRALKAFGEAVRVNAGSAEAHRGMGLSYLGLGAGDSATDVEVVDKAMAQFNEALRISPESAETRYQLGLASLLVNDKKAAVAEYQALKPLDGSLAEQLQERIAAYKSPRSFQTLMRTGGTVDTSKTRVTMAGNAVLVPVTFRHGGTTLQATMLLDTGASVSMITKELAVRLGVDLARARETRMVVADGRSVPAWHTRLDRIAVGPKSQKDIEISVVQSAGGSFPFDGLLGMNFLRSYKYSIDCASQTINWSP
jgi:clan AA aspartic protease (TIGR02281 family)